MIAADGAVGVISLVAGVFILAGDVSIPLLLAVWHRAAPWARPSTVRP